MQRESVAAAPELRREAGKLPTLWGKVSFGALFVVVLPVGLAAWAVALDRSIEWPVPQWPVFSVALVAAGLVLMAWSMVELSTEGDGLPMSVYAPKRLVTRGAYGLFRHPIYIGAWLIAFGVSLLARSSGGVYVVTPAFGAAMAAYVLGFEEPALRNRFRGEIQTYVPLFSLPPASDAKASMARKFGLAAAITVAWMLAGYLIDYARCTRSCSGAVATLSADGPTSVPLLLWTAPMLLLVLRIVVSRTDRHLRHSSVAAMVALVLGCYLYVVLPAFGFDVRSGGWELGTMMLAVTAAAVSYRRISDTLRDVAETVANSRRDWLIFGGRFRIISHAVYPGLAGAVGVAVAGFVLGDGMAGAMLGAFVLIGAALFAQVLWASPTLLRPFGFWGGVLGAVAATVTLYLVFGLRFATVALACVLAAPLIQAIGRLRCLAQGCCHGIETSPDFGIRVWQRQSRVVVMSGLGGRYILPTQLYSIVFNVLLGTLLLALYVSGEAESSFIVGLYFILTGIERFAEDAYRGEKQTRWRGPLRENQWIALASMIAGVAVTLMPSATPPAPDYDAFGPVFVLAMVLGGLLGAFAMSMDFPKATFRYSRLSG